MMHHKTVALALVKENLDAINTLDNVKTKMQKKEHYTPHLSMAIKASSIEYSIFVKANTLLSSNDEEFVVSCNRI